MTDFKFKQNVPRSIALSQISDFSIDNCEETTGNKGLDYFEKVESDDEVAGDDNLFDDIDIPPKNPYED